MPLDRQHVTAASRVMLPTYVGFFALLGVNYLTAADTALKTSAALRFADANVMPLEAWGSLFIVCALIMATALATKRRTLYRWALRMCGLSMLFWAAVITWAAFSDEASPLASIWALFVALACYASDRSLARREV